MLNLGVCGVDHPTLRTWVDEMAALCQPDRVFWCDGSEAEKAALTAEAVRTGVLVELDQQKWPGCHYHRSHSSDVARSEHLTFICTPTRDEAGPTNNWCEPEEMYQKLEELARGSMRGRTMYVVPYLMGPPGSPLAKVGVELTDSVYVVLNMRIMTRMGKAALDALGARRDFSRGLHCLLDLNPERRWIAHFPHDNTVISVGSGYGGNALLGKKCFALRLASRSIQWRCRHTCP
jgi:phosphoenolpyruvate carboxykinase (GTP)